MRSIGLYTKPRGQCVNQSRAGCVVDARAGRLSHGACAGGDIDGRRPESGLDLDGRQRWTLLEEQRADPRNLGGGRGRAAEGAPTVGGRGFVLVGERTSALPGIDLGIGMLIGVITIGFTAQLFARISSMPLDDPIIDPTFAEPFTPERITYLIDPLPPQRRRKRKQT